MDVSDPQAAPAPKRSRWYKPVLAAYAAIAGVTTLYLPPYLGQISTIWAEMTAGTRIGVQRYTFGKDKPAHLVFDLRTSLYNYPGKVSWSSIRLRPVVVRIDRQRRRTVCDG